MTYFLKELQQGDWTVSGLEGQSQKAFATEPEAWGWLLQTTGLCERQLAAQTSAQHYVGQCMKCKGCFVRISRRTGGVYLHCYNGKCSYDEKVR